MSIGSPLRWTALALLNLPLYLLLGRLFFGDWSGFAECLRFWFTPDWISLFRGDYFEDRWSEAKLFVFAALCALALYSEYRCFFGDPFGPLPTPRACAGPRAAPISGPWAARTSPPPAAPPRC